MDTVSFEEFKKIELRVAKVLAAERVEGSEKLVRLQVSLGKEERQIVAGIGTYYSPDELLGREIVIAANLEPKTMMGLESQGMLLAAGETEPVLLQPDKEVESGSSIH